MKSSYLQALKSVSHRQLVARGKKTVIIQQRNQTTS